MIGPIAIPRLPRRPASYAPGHSPWTARRWWLVSTASQGEAGKAVGAEARRHRPQRAHRRGQLGPVHCAFPTVPVFSEIGLGDFGKGPPVGLSRRAGGARRILFAQRVLSLLDQKARLAGHLSRFGEADGVERTKSHLAFAPVFAPGAAGRREATLHYACEGRRASKSVSICSPSAHGPKLDAMLIWPFSPTSRKSAPHASAMRRARSMLHRGSFELATTTLGNGSGALVSAGRRVLRVACACPTQRPAAPPASQPSRDEDADRPNGQSTYSPDCGRR